MSQLLLFDIDGTLLIKASDDHRDAIHAAITRVYGVPDPARATGVQAAGRTDLQIARQIVLQLGVDVGRFEEHIPDLKRVAAAEYATRCRDDLSAHLAAGVTDVLEELAARDDVTLSLVTGNLEPIARVKLDRAGIGRYFDHAHGGFGSDDEDRTELPAIARRRAGGANGPVPRERTVVIGDTPLDIACAQADGVRCIAVTTGPYRAEDLAAADAVVSSVREVPGLLGLR